MGGGEKRKAKIIKDTKERGEWAESVFMERASEAGLAVSKPWGDSKTFDFVVGRPGHFVGVQVKSTIAESGGGYSCSLKRNNKPYSRGSFDFVAAYVIPEDAWYIVPAEKVGGRLTLILCSNSGEAKYEEYREAWHLLRKATETCDPAAVVEEPAAAPEPAQRFPRNALERMEAAANFFRRSIERSTLAPKKAEEG